MRVSHSLDRGADVRARGAPAAIAELLTELEITSRDAEEFYGDPKSDQIMS